MQACLLIFKITHFLFNPSRLLVFSFGFSILMEGLFLWLSVAILFTSTFLLETLGAGIPSLRLLAHPELVRHDPDWFIAAFHSVSAYCNMGFAMFPDNLASFRKDLVFVLTHALFPLNPGASLGHHGLPVAYLFELVSAFGTAQFSLGITRWLHPLAKGIIIVAMFVGRVGLLTLVMPVGRE